MGDKEVAVPAVSSEAPAGKAEAPAGEAIEAPPQRALLQRPKDVHVPEPESVLRQPPRIGMLVSFIVIAVTTFTSLVLLLWKVDFGATRYATEDPAGRSTEVGMVAFGCSFILFTCSLICRADREKKKAAILVCYINAIAFCTNMLLFLKATPVLTDFFGRPSYPIRHVQWLHTTPAMIFMAAKISSYTTKQVVVAALFDSLMLATGLLSSLTTSTSVMLLAIFLSCANFVAVLVIIWNMFHHALVEARDLASYRNLQYLQAHMVFTWNIFPLAWFLGAFQIVSPEIEAYIYLAGDLSAKVVFSSLLLEGNFHSIEERRRAAALVHEENSKNALIAELKQAVTEKDRFLANVSHELRTPLNGIIGLSDTILQGSCGPVNDSLVHNLATIKKSGRRLQNLVNDILDVSSARNGKLVLRYDRVKLRPVVDHVLDLTSPMLKWSVKLYNDVASTLPEIECDQSRMIQVLHNLIGNAAKFTDEGEIRVLAKLRKNQIGQDEVAVTIQDNGIGIPQEKIKVIFGAFEQVSEEIVQQRGGTGLGLSLAETIVRAHHGSISVTSRLGKGSSFTFSLPLVQPKQNEEARSSKEEGKPPPAKLERDVSIRQRASSSVDSTASSCDGGTPPFSSPEHHGKLTKYQRESASGFTLKEQISEQCFSAGYEDGAGHVIKTYYDVYGQYEVLSVDDDPVNQMVVEGMLRPTGYKITKKMDGMQALEYLENSETTPDLMLLDVMMPGLSGYEVCRKVRQMFPASTLPVIMVSAKSQESDIVEGLKAGSNDYLTKPFKRLEILARIEAQLKIKKLWKVEMEAAKSYQLLKKMLPESIIQRLNMGQSLIADSHSEVTILFSDIVGFTEIAGSSQTSDLIFMLNDMFTGFDELVDKHGVYKVETIGDAYMVVAGHDGAPDHAERIVRMAMDMLARCHVIQQPNRRDNVRIRIGIHSGPAYAGVIGTKCPRYCFFGDTVNTASRMESNGFAMSVHCSPATYELTKTSFDFATVPRRHIKGKGPMETYLLKHGEWEAALCAFEAQNPGPLARSDSVPVISELEKDPSLSLLKQTFQGRRCSRSEPDLKALERTESAPAHLAPETDALFGHSNAERERTESESESDEPQRKRSASVPNESAQPDATKPPSDGETLNPRSRRQSHIDALPRVKSPSGPTRPLSPRALSPLSRSYSSPDLKVLIRRESASPPKRSLAEPGAQEPTTQGASTSPGSTARDNPTDRALEEARARFVQVGKTAWVLQRSRSSDHAGEKEAACVATKESLPFNGARAQRLRNLLGSDPSTYVRRLSDTSLVMDLNQEDVPTVLCLTNGNEKAKESEKRKEVEEQPALTGVKTRNNPLCNNGSAEASSVQNCDAPNDSSTDRARAASLRSQVLSSHVRHVLSDDSDAPTGVRERSRESRVELACLAAETCGFTQNSSRASSVAGTPPDSKRTSLELPTEPNGIQRNLAETNGIQRSLTEPTLPEVGTALLLEDKLSHGIPIQDGISSTPLDPISGSPNNRGRSERATEPVQVPSDPALRTVRRTRSMSPLNPRASLILKGRRDQFSRLSEGETLSEGQLESGVLAADIESEGWEDKEVLESDASGGRERPAAGLLNWYKRFAPAPLSLEEESQSESSRSSDRGTQEKNSPRSVRSTNGSDESRERSRERRYEDSAVQPANWSPTFQIDSVAVERLTEQIVEQILTQLSPSRKSPVSLRGNLPGTSTPGSPALSPSRFKEWGPWKATAAMKEDSPRVSRSPKGRTAYTEPSESRDFKAEHSESRDLKAVDVWKSNKSVPWRYELANRSRSVERTKRGDVAAGVADVASDVRRSGSWSSLEAMYAPYDAREQGFKGLQENGTWQDRSPKNASPRRNENGGRRGQKESDEGHTALEDFLRELGLQHYTDTLIKEEVTLEVLSKLTSEQLKEVGVTHLGARLRILEALKNLS